MKKPLDENNIFEPETVISASDETISANRWGSLVLKILAVLGAFLIWLYASSMNDPNYTRDIVGVKVDPEPAPANGLTLVSGGNHTVNIKIQGNRNLVENLSIDEISAKVDISGLTEPQRTTLPVEVILPEGVYLISQSVREVSVYVDQVKQKSVQVQVELQGYYVEEGYTIGQHQPSVSEIVVEGPEIALQEIAVAKGTVDVGRISTSVTARVPLKLYNRDGVEVTNAFVKKNVDSVNVNIPLLATKKVPLAVQFTEDKDVDHNIVEVGIEPSYIEVSGTVEALRDIDRIALTPIDLRRLNTESMTVAIQVPTNLNNVSKVKEATLSFRYKDNITTKQIWVSRENIQIKNPNGLNCEIIDESIPVNLRGAEDRLSMMTEENLTVLLDLSNYTNVSGQAYYALSVSVDGIYKKKVYAYGDYKVAVNVSS